MFEDDITAAYLPTIHTDSISTVNPASPSPTSTTSGTTAATRSTSVVPLLTDTSTTNTEIVGATRTIMSPDAELCQKFLQDTCGCTKNDGKACSGLFSVDHYIELRAQASFLTHDELDLTLMGSIMSTLLTDDVSWCRHKPAKRNRFRQQYMHNGHTICRSTFTFLYGIGKKRLQNVKDAYNRNGLEVRIHKNAKSLPHNCFSSDVIENFKRFLSNYAEENAILLPGRIPGYKRDDIKLLPCSCSKKVSENLSCA